MVFISSYIAKGGACIVVNERAGHGTINLGNTHASATRAFSGVRT
jgi:hypothetical protein